MFTALIARALTPRTPLILLATEAAEPDGGVLTAVVVVCCVVGSVATNVSASPR